VEIVVVKAGEGENVIGLGKQMKRTRGVVAVAEIYGATHRQTHKRTTRTST